jgi:hypothetical protein
MMKSCTRCGRPTGSKYGVCGNRALKRCAELAKAYEVKVTPKALPPVLGSNPEPKRKTKLRVPRNGLVLPYNAPVEPGKKPEASWLEKFRSFSAAMGVDGESMIEAWAKDRVQRMQQAALDALNSSGDPFGDLFRNVKPAPKVEPRVKVTRTVRSEVDISEDQPQERGSVPQNVNPAGEAASPH